MDRNICEDGTLATENNTCLYAWYDNGDNENNNATNTLGPIAAMSKLYNGTKDWTNVSNMNLEYDDTENNNTGEYGYTGITITDGVGYITDKGGNSTDIELTNNKPIKARLPKLSEVISEEVGCHKYSSDSDSATCPTWMVENLDLSAEFSVNNACKEKYEKTSKIKNIFGYWLLSSQASSELFAYRIRYAGYVRNYRTENIHSNPFYLVNGIRPVISVLKENIEN